MTPRALIRAAADEFRAAGVPDPEVDASVLLSHLCGRPPLVLRLDDEILLPEETAVRYRELCERRLRREPLQYILREAPFCGFTFYVDSRVLIPRPETELLCEWAAALLSGREHPAVLDLCCGSGCLGIALKRLVPSAAVWGADISSAALAVSRMNASRLNADVRLVQSDLFTSLPDQAFDLIVSNPPYIPSSVCEDLQPEVTQEPALALDGGADGLSFYRRICAAAPDRLRPGGVLLMELGDGQAPDVKKLMQSAGFAAVEIREDYRSVPRMIAGTYV